MKSRVRLGSLVVALGIAALLAGCASHSSSSTYRVQPAHDFEVVETSTKRQLTPREMAYLKAKVAEYLAQEGKTESGDYYVKIYLGEEKGVKAGDWVVVRFTRYPATRLSLVASYPSSYPRYEYHSYDYYPFGLYGFGSLAFRYYDDPYYRGHIPRYPTWYRPRHGGHWRNRDRKDDGDGAHRPHHGNRPSGALKPSFVPAPAPRDQAPALTFDGRHRNNRGDWQRRNGGPAQSQERRSPGFVPQPTSNYAPAPAASAEAGVTNYRPATRGNLFRDRATSDAPRHQRPDAPTPRAQGGRDRDYSAPSHSQAGQHARNQEPLPRPEQSSEQESRPASQPATRSVLHDGGRTGRRY